MKQILKACCCFSNYQVMLLNPICTVMYAAASWKFFQQRIREEEITLLHFFGDAYVDYQRKVNTGIPFVYGYRIDPVDPTQHISGVTYKKAGLQNSQIRMRGQEVRRPEFEREN